MTVSVCFFTVCGGGEEYDFLLGGIKYHAAMGRHVVLDTTPAERRREFKGLPPSVRWVHEPNFGSGWAEFNGRAALDRACRLARESGAEVVAHLDCDEFFTPDSVGALFPHAIDTMLTVETVHWRKDGTPYFFGQSEIHRRLWPASWDVVWPVNEAWVNSPAYTGNPNRHSLVQHEGGKPRRYAVGWFHHHLHYALGKKSDDESTAKATIQGWPNGTPLKRVPWPEPLAKWRDKGILPSLEFAT